MAKDRPFTLKSNELLPFNLFDLTEEQLEQLHKDAKSAWMYVGGKERCQRVDEMVKQLKVLYSLAPEQFKDVYIEVGETVQEFRYGRISAADFVKEVKTEKTGVTDLSFYEFVELDKYDYGDSSDEYIVVHYRGSGEAPEIVQLLKELDTTLPTEVTYHAYNEYRDHERKKDE